MKLIEFLDAATWYSGELVINGWEFPWSFEWDFQTKFTEDGKRKFKKILQSEVRYYKGNLFIDNENVTYEEAEYLIALVAGYTINTDYNKYIQLV